MKKRFSKLLYKNLIKHYIKSKKNNKNKNNNNEDQ